MRKKKRFFWFERNYWPSYDGAIGAASLKADTTVFLLAKETSKLQIKITEKLESKNRWQIKVPLSGGSSDVNVLVSFRFRYEKTRGNLVLTQILKHSELITMGKTTTDIEREFGIPAKAVKGEFVKPIYVFGRPLTIIDMQIPIHAPMPSHTETDEVAKTDEVVVQAERKRKNGKHPPEIFLGRDFLEGCSKVEFDRKAKLVHLYCD